MEKSEPQPARLTVQQPKLFDLENPLSARLGNEFFTALPRVPGVYFFHDESDRLLYIGQSSNLRARLGSYRHVSPDRHPQRTLRLVARVRKIVWQTCATAGDAVALESSLLMEHKPPFNRAGVWAGAPWWLKITTDPKQLRLELLRQTETGTDCLGPFPSWFRHGLGLLARCLFRAVRPEARLAEYPRGLLAEPPPLMMPLEVPHPSEVANLLRLCLEGDVTFLEEKLTWKPACAVASLQEWHEEEMKSLRKLGPKLRKAWAEKAAIKIPEDDALHSLSEALI